MVRRRIKPENLSKDELIDEVLSLENFKNDIIDYNDIIGAKWLF